MEENRFGTAIPTNATVNVKEAVEAPIFTTREREDGGSPFIKPYQIDANAAYERARITKDLMKMYKEEINRTNTSDITGTLKRLYEDLEKIMKEIVKEEKQLMILGE